MTTAAAVVALMVFALVAGGSGGVTPAQASPAVAQAAPGLTSVKHVFVIVLENEDGDDTFGPTNPAPYLSQTMRSEGAFVPNYYGIGHASLDNYIAMISGQAPNPSTQADCGTFSDFPAGTAADIDGDGEYTHPTCVYPPTVQTVADQLDTAGDTWKAYEDSMATPCLNSGLNNAELYNGEPPHGAYATRHDPFMYFHSILDSVAFPCAAHVVNLQSNLANDLSSVLTTPNYSFITPDVCDDGHDADSTCESNYSRHGGYTGINGFLSSVVPMITSSPAYKQDGLLIVTFDESANDDTSCCGEAAGPASGGAQPGQGGPGGGKVGAVLMSPFITPGTVSMTPYNQYSMLGSVEDAFGLSRLGYAAGTTPFGSDIFGAPVSSSSSSSSSSTSSSTPSSSSSTTSTPVSNTSSSSTTSATTTTTTTSPPATSTTSKPACVASTIPKKIKKLPASVVLRGVTVTGAGKAKHKLKFTALHAAKLKLVFKPKSGHAATQSHSLAACHSYAYTLPAGHGTITITVSVGKHAATVVKHV